MPRRFTREFFAAHGAAAQAAFSPAERTRRARIAAKARWRRRHARARRLKMLAVAARMREAAAQEPAAAERSA